MIPSEVFELSESQILQVRIFAMQSQGASKEQLHGLLVDCFTQLKIKERVVQHLIGEQMGVPPLEPPAGAVG